MTKNQTLCNVSLAIGLIINLLALNCRAEAAQAEDITQKVLKYESSLSEFKSINNDKDKLSAKDAAKDMQGMDHSKMSAEEMTDMKGMDHSKMSAEEMKDMKGMDHSKMSAEEMKAVPKKSAKPSNVKKLKSVKKPALPAKADAHQNHQM